MLYNVFQTSLVLAFFFIIPLNTDFVVGFIQAYACNNYGNHLERLRFACATGLPAVVYSMLMRLAVGAFLFFMNTSYSFTFGVMLLGSSVTAPFFTLFFLAPFLNILGASIDKKYVKKFWRRHKSLEAGEKAFMASIGADKTPLNKIAPLTATPAPATPASPAALGTPATPATPAPGAAAPAPTPPAPEALAAPAPKGKKGK